MRGCSPLSLSVCFVDKDHESSAEASSSFYLYFQPSCHFFFHSGLSSQVIRTNLDREIRKSLDPEMYAVCDIFETLCSDTIGISAVCSRLSNLSGVLVALRNQLVSKIFLSVLEIEQFF